MSTRFLVQSKSAPTASSAPARSGVLQRKCACGGKSGAAGECAQCSRKPKLGVPGVGPTFGRNSAVGPVPNLQRQPQPDPTQSGAPQLSAHVTNKGRGKCGDVNYEITWDLSKPAGPLGGYVVQEVLVEKSSRNCSGRQVVDPRWQYPFTFHEAWRVQPNSRVFWPGPRDIFRSSEAQHTFGHMRVTAVGRYFDNVAELPDHMIHFNPDTPAQALPSSRTDPNLTGEMSNEVPHNLEIRWNCCGKPNRPTKVVAHNP